MVILFFILKSLKSDDLPISDSHPPFLLPRSLSTGQLLNVSPLIKCSKILIFFRLLPSWRRTLTFHSVIYIIFFNNNNIFIDENMNT